MKSFYLNLVFSSLVLFSGTQAICDDHSRNGAKEFHFGPVPDEEEKSDEKI